MYRSSRIGSTALLRAMPLTRRRRGQDASSRLARSDCRRDDRGARGAFDAGHPWPAHPSLSVSARFDQAAAG